MAERVLEKRKKENDRNLWFKLCVGEARYRQRRYKEADPFLEQALESDDRTIRLLALTFSAMSLLQQDKQDLANDRLDELGVFSACDSHLPTRFRFFGRHDILAAWFLQSELRSLIPELDFNALTIKERIDFGLRRQARHVQRKPDDLNAAHQLAGLYAWFYMDQQHHDQCQRLIDQALESDDVDDQYRAALYFLSHRSSSNDHEMIGQAKTLARNAADSVDANSLTRETAEKLAHYQLACALAEIRLGNYQEADQWLQRAEPIITLAHRGRWSALRAINQSRLGEAEQARAALANAELMTQPAPSRHDLSIELVEPSDDDHDFILISWLLLDEARSLVSEIAGDKTDPTPIRPGKS